MKNIVVQVVKVLGIIVAVLAINVVTGYLAMSAFLMPMLKADWILGAVCGFFALPGILAQPWFLLFLPTGFLAPILTTLVTVLVYRRLDDTTAFGQIKRLLKGLKTPKITFVAVCAVVLGLGVGYARTLDFPPLHRGVPKILVRQVNNVVLDSQDGRYYCLYRLLGSEWIWQARISQETLKALVAELQMSSVANEDISSTFMKMPPYWWEPTVSETTQAYSTKNFYADGRGGPDSWHAFMTWEPESQILQMWIKDNF